MADFLGGLMSRRVAVLAVVTVSQTAGLVVIGVIVAASGEPAPDSAFLPYSLLAGVAGVCGVAAFYAAMSVGKMGVVAPISSMAVLVPVTVGLATGDRPSGLQVAGAALGLAGVVLVSRQPDEDREAPRGKLGAGVGLALLAGLGFGSFFVVMDVAADYDPLWANLVHRATSVSLGWLAVLAVRPSFEGVGGRVAPVLVCVGVLEMAANLCFALAATEGLLSITSVLSSLYPVVTVCLAWIVLRERLHGGQMAGAAAALCGVALIAGG